MMYKSVVTGDTYFEGYTIFLPCISVGNVSQLVVDLLVATLELHRAGYMYDDSILPLVGNDPYAPPTAQAQCNLVTSVEVYYSREKKVAVLQQRAPCVKGKRKQFVSKMCKWIKEQKFAKVVLLASIFAHERRDKQLQGPQFRFFTTPALQSLNTDLQEVGWRELEKRHELADVMPTSQTPDNVTCSADQYFMPGSGSMYQFVKQCEEDGLSALCVLCFCAEGDNAIDALNMAAYLNTHFHWLSNENSEEAQTGVASKWKIPPSWQLLFGSRFQQILY